MAQARTGARRNARRRETRLAFEALQIEGGLLAPEWLAKVARLEAGGQAAADYRVPKGLELRDEIGRYWRIAQALWADFTAGKGGAADPHVRAVAFARSLLREAFGFSTLAAVEPVHIHDRTYPVGLAALVGKAPVVVAPAEAGLDSLLPAFGEGGRRRSAFGLVQEYLNADPDALWGLACDGSTLRLARDNASLTRPAWVEADLARIFGEERYADFAALWLLAHESRFGAADRPASDCSLEAWRNAGREEGTRALGKLRVGVKEAVRALGAGFVAHPHNAPLRTALERGELDTRGFFGQLLRLVYRLIFLLTIEERGLLHADGVPDAVQQLYSAGYSLKGLRERSVRRSAHDRHSDLWEAARIVFRGLEAGEPRLGLPALAGLFASRQCPALDGAKLENRALLLAMFHLCWLRDDAGLSRVNWRDMGPEELGSVYESLLELEPQVSVPNRTFFFAEGTQGNARKTTGSYYTPDSLVQVLLDSALEPVAQQTIAEHPDRPAEALLELSIVDPACGSGHFLLAAARRVAAHVARLQAGGTPSAAEYRHALRQVVGRCIYGVDLNPMAVELCKVALWMEAVEPGLPLTFLDSHIRCGNALLGTTPELMERGIPDEAWEAIEGDDKKAASALKKRNKQEAAGQLSMVSAWSAPTASESEQVTRAVAELDSASDADARALAAKESRWSEILASGPYCHQKFVADAWCSAFVWPKPSPADPLVAAAPTMALWRDIGNGRGQPPALMVKTVEELADQHQFFHWHLAFPTVFAKGGFNVVIGNPPWERVTLKEQEWFAIRDTWVASAGMDSERLERISALQETDPNLYCEFIAAKRSAAGEKVFLRRSKAYPKTGHGDVNTFAVFAELGWLVSSSRAGMVLPTGIVTSEATQDFAAELISGGCLVSVFDFDNRAGIFPAVQGNVRFCLLTTSHHPVQLIKAATQLRSTDELKVIGRVWTLEPMDALRINPNTGTLPLFLNERDSTVVQKLYRRNRCLDEPGGDHAGRWDAPMQRMLHMGDDSHFFRTENQLAADGFLRDGESWLKGQLGYVPLLESKLCHQYDHRAATFAGIPPEARLGTHPATNPVSDEEHMAAESFAEPRYWVPAQEVQDRIGKRAYLVGFRNAVSATADARSLIAAILPPHGAGHSLLFFFTRDAQAGVFVAAWFNSFVTDFVFRLKSSGSNASFYLLRQLPIPGRDVASAAASWDHRLTVLEWVAPRVLEATYTSWSLLGFGKELGYDGPPFRWDPDRRFLLRCELDAAFFHLYGLSRDDTDYIMDTFPIVRKNDEKAHGEYRTKRVILEIYDEMATASRTGHAYETRLDPPPADPRVAHPPRDVAN